MNSELFHITSSRYTLSARIVSGRPPAERRATSSVRFLWSGTGELEGSIAGRSFSITKSYDLSLEAPLLTENSRVALYVTGPQMTIVKTGPRADSITEVARANNFQHFEIEYRGAVGDIFWTWLTPDGKVELRMECFPTKLDYRRDFRNICDELEKIAPTLTATPTGAAGGGFGEEEGKQSSSLEWLEMVRRTQSNLEGSMDRLLPRLRTHLQSTTTIVMSDRLRSARPLSKRAYSNFDARPRPIPARVLRQDRSTALNGHLRWAVDRLRTTVLSVVQSDWFERLDSNIAAPVAELADAVARWQSEMSDVIAVPKVDNFHVGLRDPLYESAFADLRALWRALRPLREAEPVGLKDLPTLYEYWVFLRVTQILRMRFPVVIDAQNMMVRNAGSQLVMTAGRKSSVVLADTSGRRIRCQYRRLFRGLPTTDQEPDAIISIEGSDKYLIIDAKYRIGQDSRYINRYGMAGPLADDLNVLHRYRDAIVDGQAPFSRLTHAGLIAFPGVESKKYQYHQFYRSWLAVGVGGIPMLPGGTTMMEEALEKYLAEKLGGAAA